MHVNLSVIGGPHTGRSFTFSEHKTFIVGRSPEAHFSLPESDQYFSRMHFMVEVNPPLCRLIDLNSKNHTFVNGKEAKVQDLHNGDTITGGQTQLLVSIIGGGGPETLAIQPGPPAAIEVGPQPEGTPEELANRAMDDMADRWERNERVTAEAYLKAWPALAADPTAAVDVIYQEFCALDEMGEDPWPDDYEARFPQYAKQLARQFQFHGGIQTALPRDRPKPPAPSAVKPAPAFKANIQVDGYDLTRLLGKGNMGVVYFATRKSDGLQVALKVVAPNIPADKPTIKRFLREVDVMRKLDHPHIVKLFDSGDVGGKFWFAMEFIDGENADQAVRAEFQLTRRGLPAGRAVRLACQLLDGLDYAHARGYVHRDIKPANLLVAAGPDGRDVLRLADFGLARTYQETQMSGLTLSGTVGGTLAFMAPEQLLDFRGAKPAADQFSAAATLYYLLSAQLMYDDVKNRSLLFQQILHKGPVPLLKRQPDLPPGLLAVVAKALSHKAEDRYGTAAEFRAALEPFAG